MKQEDLVEHVTSMTFIELLEITNAFGARRNESFKLVSIFLKHLVQVPSMVGLQVCDDGASTT